MSSAAAGAALSRIWPPPGPLDVALTLRPLARGAGDPTHRVLPSGIWRTAVTPEGPATVRLVVADAIRADAWGPGAEWMLAAVPDLLGASDSAEGLVPSHAFVAAAARRMTGLRLARTGLVFEQVVPAVLEQKVTGTEARRSWRELLRRFGSAPPGPAPEGMRLLPSPAEWLAIPDWEWHRAGVDSTRRRAIRAAATVAGRLEECAAMPVADAVRRLRSLPGIGVWTAAEVVQRALGAPDEVSVGDYHVAAWVGWALIGRPLDDDGMLAELAPYAGHRQRVVRMVEAGYVKPRFGPRATVRDYRAM
ncbi:MAG TPA: DNA-3-methyladenine glycosylase 2 family protein [Mycobacteriales bacterium]|nr:DNA-3-methyladenine glycosylase 2 family protein [Mycobacteriales bacterium]